MLGGLTSKHLSRKMTVLGDPRKTFLKLEITSAGRISGQVEYLLEQSTNSVKLLLNLKYAIDIIAIVSLKCHLFFFYVFTVNWNIIDTGKILTSEKLKGNV